MVDVRWENLEVFAEEALIASAQITLLARRASKGSRNIKTNSDLSESALDEIKAKASSDVDLLDDVSSGRLSEANQQIKVLAELVKPATPAVYRDTVEFINGDPATPNSDFGKFRKVSDDTVVFDPATL